MSALRCPNCGPDAVGQLNADLSMTCVGVTQWTGSRATTGPGCGLTLRLCRAHGLRTVRETGSQTRCECGQQAAPRAEEAAKAA